MINMGKEHHLQQHVITKVGHYQNIIITKLIFKISRKRYMPDICKNTMYIRSTCNNIYRAQNCFEINNFHKTKSIDIMKKFETRVREYIKEMFRG